MKKFIQDLIVTAIAIVTSFLTALILVVVEQTLGFSFYSYMLWFVIPIGAICSGFVAASGYYLGSKWFNHKPSKLILINMLAVSTATFFLIYYLSYISLVIDGKQVSNYISFVQYLAIVLGNMSYSLCFHYVNCSSGVQLGSFGYLVGVLQILGFFLGGVSIYSYLSSEIYCDNCMRYYSSKKSQTRYFPDTESASKHYKEIVELLQNGKYQEAIDNHASSGSNDYKSSMLASKIDLKYCKKCLRHYIKFGMLAKNKKKEWVAVKDTFVFRITEPNTNFNLRTKK